MGREEQVRHTGAAREVVPAERREGEQREPERLGGGTSGVTSAKPGKARDAEVPEKARRRRFSAEYKRRILEQADGCTEPGEIGALLRREGLYTSHLSVWRRQREEGTLAGLERKRGRKVRRDARDREIERLKRETERLRGKLQQAELVIEIQKKASEMLGIPLRSLDDEESGS